MSLHAAPGNDPQPPQADRGQKTCGLVSAGVWCAEAAHDRRLGFNRRCPNSHYGHDFGMSVSTAMRVRWSSAWLAFLVILVTAPLAAEEHEAPAHFREAYLLWQEGYQLHLAGAYEEAIKRFEASIEVHPTAEAHTFPGWSMSYLGRLEQAIAECEKAIALDPDYGNPYNDIGVYLIDLGRPDEAIGWLEKALGAKRYCCYQFSALQPRAHPADEGSAPGGEALVRTRPRVRSELSARPPGLGVHPHPRRGAVARRLTGRCACASRQLKEKPMKLHYSVASPYVRKVMAVASSGRSSS
ncbi:MAG TPA: tetratricopeptide repeat protein [Geminicoccaceae bacterium]|nr:tetratricopeptide repeat protein [Geminicoccaceae bacterium]